MASLAEYFAKNRYQCKYYLGDRVFGYWNKIPFVGSVGTDSVVSELDGPRVSVQLDLPIKLHNKKISVIIVKHKDIKQLTVFDETSILGVDLSTVNLTKPNKGKHVNYITKS
jgi:hypothetical protein